MLNFSQYHRLNIVCKKSMEHNYEVKTSNRVLTVARSSGRITEDFLWLAGCFMIHIWSQSEGESGPGLTRRVQDCVMF